MGSIAEQGLFDQAVTIEIRFNQLLLKSAALMSMKRFYEQGYFDRAKNICAQAVPLNNQSTELKPKSYAIS